jgi:SAM-dependent methyltransferase
MMRWLRTWAEKDGRGYPDWAMRYVPLVRTITPLLKPDTRMVEIGTNANGLARFLPAGVRVYGANLDVGELRDACAAQPIVPFMADASALPLATEGAQICVCMDTLEHIPQDLRRRVVCELIRATSPDGLCVIAFPSGPAAMTAEARVRAAYRQLTGGDLRWVAEHQANGLPDADEVVQWAMEAAGNGRAVRLTWNTPTWLWVWSWRVLMCNWPGRGNAIAQALLRAITPLLCGGHLTKGYRAVLWVGSPEIIRDRIQP